MPRQFSNTQMRDMVCVYAQESFNGRRANNYDTELKML